MQPRDFHCIIAQLRQISVCEPLSKRIFPITAAGRIPASRIAAAGGFRTRTV